MRFVGSRQDDGLATRREVPGERAPEVADADDCGCQCDSFPSCHLSTGIFASATGPSNPGNP
jgi:hypothetical protein